MLNPIYFDRAIAKGKTGNLIIFILAVLIFVPIMMCVCGIIGQQAVLHYESSESLRNGLFWDTLEVYLDPSNKPHNVGFSRRFYFLIVGTAGIFLLNGLLVSMLVSWFENRKDRWEKGDLHYGKKSLGNYCVVIGGNNMVPDLVEQILQKSEIEHVLVMTTSNVASLRKRMVSKLGKKEERVIFYYGDCTSIEDLEYLMFHNTQNDIYVIGEQIGIGKDEGYHDVKNMDCVQKIATLLKKNGITSGKRICRVMLEYQSTFSMFQYTDVNQQISEILDFKPFNFYETWAQKVLICKELDLQNTASSYLPLEGKMPITSISDDYVHLVVMGMSQMGIALAVQAAYLAHYPNFITKGKRTRITFIDPQAKKEMLFFQGRYRELFALSRWRYVDANSNVIYDGNNEIEIHQWYNPRNDNKNSLYRERDEYSLGEQLVDVDWQFIQGDIEMNSIQEYIKRESQRPDVRLNIAFCVPQDNAALAAALYIPREVYDEESNVVQVLVYQPFGDTMCNSYANNPKELYRGYRMFGKLRAFGMMDGGYSMENQEILKKISDAINLEYNNSSQTKIPGRNRLRKSFKMETIKAGKPLASKQWSGYYAASHLWTKLRSIGYNGKDIELQPEVVDILTKVEHIRWNMEQLLLGYSPLKSDEYAKLMDKRNKALAVPMPQQELKKLQDCMESDKKEECERVIEWLNVWKEYDDMKEMFKANMSHADICSFEVLEQIDKEAIEYDRELVCILPRIYKQLF